MKRIVLMMSLSACGGGVPVQLRIDEFAMELPLDQAVDNAYQQLATGFLGSETAALPELWPASLPQIRYQALIASPSMPIDLSPDPEEDPAADPSKYEAINKAKDVIERIEINRFILRVEASTLTITLPELRLQVADDKNARGDDRLAWQTVGKLPATPEPRWVGDLEFEFEPGGESYLNAQIADAEKELAMRVVGKLVVDTAASPARPAGNAMLRLILVATFFVRPEGAI